MKVVVVTNRRQRRYQWRLMLCIPLVCLGLAGFEMPTLAGESEDRPWIDAQGHLAGELAITNSLNHLSSFNRGVIQPAEAESLENVDLTSGNLFGQADSLRWALMGGAANDVDEDGENYNLHFVVSKFFTNDFNLSLELGGMYFDQADFAEDTGGVNANLLLRWHFVNKETYSFYVDAGAGLLYVDEDVPFDGANFNFTPQAGIGLSLEVDDARDIRIFAGVRWHHVSNANLSSSDNNPGRDAILGYVGLDFPIR